MRLLNFPETRVKKIIRVILDSPTSEPGIYFDGKWHVVNSSLEIYTLGQRKRWFHSEEYGVFLFEGADTSAIGGGELFYRLVSHWTTDPDKALGWLIDHL